MSEPISTKPPAVPPDVTATIAPGIGVPTPDVAGKATHTAGEATLSSDVLDLLEAIRDAVDVPLPALDDADQMAYHALMTRRLSELHIILDVALSPEWRDTTVPADEAADIRRCTAATPVTYARYARHDAAASGTVPR